MPPIMHIAQIDLSEANRLLLAWGHRMGPCNRPDYGIWCHGLFEHGEPVAVTVTATLIRETCAGLTRDEAVELARLCASRPRLCRIMVRAWSEIILPALGRVHGYVWGVSFQDAAIHHGYTYRSDGWLPIGKSRSGTDPRSGRKGRNKVIWGWPAAGHAPATPAAG